MKMKWIGALLVTVVLFSVSCDYGRQAEDRLDEINTKAEELDALFNEELKKVKELDSLIPEANKKIKKADSLIENTSKALDSLSRKVKAIENIFN